MFALLFVTTVHLFILLVDAVPKNVCVEYRGLPMILHDGMKYQMSISGSSEAELLHKQKQQVLVIDSIKASEQEALEYMISLQTSKFPLHVVCVCVFMSAKFVSCSAQYLLHTSCCSRGPCQAPLHVLYLNRLPTGLSECLWIKVIYSLSLR